MHHATPDFRPHPGRSAHFQMSVSTQQRPERAANRQQQQSSGEGELRPRRPQSGDDVGSPQQSG